MSPCPRCGRDMDLVGRSHNCTPADLMVTRATVTNSDTAPAEKVVTRVVTRRRDRAAYMRAYRAKGKTGGDIINGPLGFGS